MMTWRRTPQGEYLSSAQYWDADSGEFKPVYVIKKSEGLFVLYIRGNIHTSTYLFPGILDAHISAARFATLRLAKNEAKQIEAEKSTSYQTEEDKGFAEGGGWSGAACIDAEGHGCAWHTDDDGNIIDD